MGILDHINMHGIPCFLIMRVCALSSWMRSINSHIEGKRAVVLLPVFFYLFVASLSLTHIPLPRFLSPLLLSLSSSLFVLETLSPNRRSLHLDFRIGSSVFLKSQAQAQSITDNYCIISRHGRSFLASAPYLSPFTHPQRYFPPHDFPEFK